MSSVHVGSAAASPSPHGTHHSQHHGVIIAACLFSVFALLLIPSLCYVRRISRQNNSVAAAATASSASCQREGKLEPELLASLPVFVYSLSTAGCQEKALDCAVCLAEFREGEKGRKLPRCGHSFHAECIDMWLESHSNCPLCRVTVAPESADSAV